MGVDWVAISAVSGAVLAASTISVFVFRHLHPRIVAARQFIEHLVGVPHNPVTGQERIAGLFERLDSIEARIEERLDSQDAALAKQDDTLADQNGVLETIRHELFPNSGKSMRDDQNKLAQKVNDLAEALATHLKNCPPKESE